MNGDLRAQLRAWLSKQGRRRQQQQQEMFLEEQQEEQQQQHLEVEEEGDSARRTVQAAAGSYSHHLQHWQHEEVNSTMAYMPEVCSFIYDLDYILHFSHSSDSPN